MSFAPNKGFEIKSRSSHTILSLNKTAFCRFGKISTLLLRCKNARRRVLLCHVISVETAIKTNYMILAITITTYKYFSFLVPIKHLLLYPHIA